VGGEDCVGKQRGEDSWVGRRHGLVGEEMVMEKLRGALYDDG
jgi:hypothetical protein